MERTKATDFLVKYWVLFLIPIIIFPPVGAFLFGLFFVPILVFALFAQVIRLAYRAIHSLR